MIKTSFLDFRSPALAVKNSIKSKWFPSLVLIPLSVFFLYHAYEAEWVKIVTAVFPKEPDKSAGFYRDFLHIVFSELLWLSGFFLLAWVLVIYAPLPRFFKTNDLLDVGKGRLLVISVVALSFAGSLFIAFVILRQFPNSSDEYAYLYQARTLGTGKLWEAAHTHPDFFYFNHIAQKDGISVGRFPPGWPSLLSSAFFLRFNPALVNPVLAILTLILFYSFVRRFYSTKVAVWSLIALGLSSFYIFNAASFFSHMACAFFTVTFVYSIYLYMDNRKPVYAVVAGLSIGMVLITRYFTAVLIFLPFFLYVIRRMKWASIRTFSWMAVGGLPCLLFLFWYNNAITGSPLLPVTIWAYADESLGFVRGHTVAKGLEHLVRWTGMFLYWCSPALLILYAIVLWQKMSSKADRWLRPEDYFFVILMCGYFFYYQIGGNQYGPRFFFEALPFLVVFVVNRMFQLKAKWAMALFAAGMLFAVVKFPFIAARERRVVDERNDLYQAVDKQDIHNAIVFVSSYTSVIRPMPIGDLTRNDASYSNDVLYAIDLGERNKALMAYYPNRVFYRYHRQPDHVEGVLEKVR